MFSINYTSPNGGQMVLYLSGPSAASHPIAHAPAGYADAITSRYSIRWFDASGTLLRVIERPIRVGPLVSDEERIAMEAKMKSDRSSAERMGGRFPDMTLPTHKHPLDDLFFDLDGRLWVTRTRAAGDTVALADVFEQNGSYLFTVHWPARVTLNHGVIQGDVAYGVGRDALDVASVVRLRMQRLGR
jgi:hypothetical protein